MSKKVYYLSSEVQPFSDTYGLSEFSKKICSRIHDLPDFDIRLNQPKYGYISERKYILREVIRLKDMLIEFSTEEELVNLKSAFIPNTRVQIYFTESENHFHELNTTLMSASRSVENNSQSAMSLHQPYLLQKALTTPFKMFHGKVQQ